jgi:HPt (histidine-containing phosphotransfer) domain-containing protein
MVRFCLLVALLFSLSPQGKAAERIMPGEPLYPRLHIHVDREGTQTFEEVRKDAAFQEGSPILGFQDLTLWVRMEIENPEAQPQDIVLEDQWSLTDFIDIHQIKPDGSHVHLVRGHKAPAFPGQRLHRYPYASLVLEPGVHTFYVQYRSHDIVGSRLALWHEMDFHLYALVSQLAYGLLLGCIVVMSLYNFFLYLSLRILAYLYYSGYSLAFFMFQLCFSGFFAQITGQYRWWLDEGTIFFAMFTMIGIVFFTQSFLQLKTRSRLLYHGGWPAASLGIAAFSLTFFDFQSAAMAVITANLVTALWIIICAMYTSWKRVPEGIVYLVAWGIFVVGDVTTILYYVGLARPGLFTQWGMVVGSVTEVVILSFGLANSVHRMRQEMNKAKEQLNLELAQSLTRVEAQVQSQTRDIRLILQNIQQGIFTIEGEKLLIREEHSAALLPMLGESSVSGRSFTEVILKRLDLDADQRSQIASALVSMQSEDAISFDLNAHVLPREIHLLRSEDDRRILELNWEPMVNEASQVERILVTLRDVTLDRELQAKTRDQSEEIMIISAIVQGDPRLFGMFLKASRGALLKAFEYARREGGGQDMQQDIHRILHTLKGNARTEKLQNMARIIHECEEKFHSGNLDVDDLKLIENELRRYQKIFDRYFAVHFNLDAVNILRDDLLALNEFLKKENFEKQAALVRGWLQKSLFSLNQLQSRMKEDIARLATELGKEPCMLHCRFENVYVNHEIFEALTDVCGHLLRNSLDHGLETAGERMQAGKTPYGHIQINFVNGSDPCITWRDDGRGLDLQKILTKAQERGLDAGHSLDSMDAEFCQSILTASGFTTRREASLISGRGVGLDAVQHRLLNMGGRLELRFTEERSNYFQSFEFILWLPKKSLRTTETLTRIPLAS